MAQNSETSYAWKRSIDALATANDTTWSANFVTAEKLLETRTKELSSGEPIDDEERRELLAAEAYLFSAKVQTLGYAQATAEHSGPARASDQTPQAVTDSNGKDIENPT
jgi:hypothetical protein